MQDFFHQQYHNKYGALNANYLFASCQVHAWRIGEAERFGLNGRERWEQNDASREVREGDFKVLVTPPW